MEVKEKLELFRVIVTEDAAAKGRRELASAKAFVKDAFDEHRKEKQDAVKTLVAEETIRIRKEETMRVFEYRQEARREVAAKERELSERLFELAEKKLADCRKTPAYREYLVRLAASARAFAGEEELQLFLDGEDEPHFAAIEEAAGVRPQVSSEKLGGGMRAILPNRRICVENAWKPLLADARTSFHFEGGETA